MTKEIAGQAGWTRDVYKRQAQEVGASLRASVKTAISDYDPAGIEAYLRAVDTSALKRELDRRSTLEVLAQHRAEIRVAAEEDPTPENLYELAFAEFALGHFHEALEAIRAYVQRALDQMNADAVNRERHREETLNGYLQIGRAHV